MEKELLIRLRKECLKKILDETRIMVSYSTDDEWREVYINGLRSSVNLYDMINDELERTPQITVKLTD